MPLTISNPVLGYVGFCAVKFAGYSLAGHVLSGSYQRTDRNPFVVGGVRTLIGMVVGATLYLMGMAGPFIFGGLIPVRIAEWWLIVWLFYDRPMQQYGKDWCYVVFGTGWSFLLDVPAVYGFIITGGVAVC